MAIYWICCVFCFFLLMIRLPPRSTRTDTLFPYTTLFRSEPLPKDRNSALGHCAQEERLTLALFANLRFHNMPSTPRNPILSHGHGAHAGQRRRTKGADPSPVACRRRRGCGVATRLGPLAAQLCAQSARSEERRDGIEGVSTCRSRWSR